MTWEIRQGDCIEQMAEMDEASVDAIVTDPPYGLEFMGKEWDRLGDIGKASHQGFAEEKGFKGFRLASYSSSSNLKCQRCGKWKWDYPKRKCECGADAIWPNVKAAEGLRMQEWHQAWAEQALRVLKPGGHLLAFGGTRTYHRLACAIEDAGFEIRDCIAWIYGSGFPKSLDVSKAIDKAAGAEREIVGESSAGAAAAGLYEMGIDGSRDFDLTAPATPEAAQWDGWGTALKPAHEPIVVARKPLIGTVAQNVLEHGTGALNVDACRIDGPKGAPASPSERRGVYGKFNGRDGEDSAERRYAENGSTTFAATPGPRGGDAAGRWPANVALDPEAARLLDEQSGERVSGKVEPHHADNGKAAGRLGAFAGAPGRESYGDRGGASRFFPTFAFSTLETCPLHGDASTGAANTSAGKRAASSAGSSPTDGSGSRSTDRSHPDTTSTTGTKTRLTTTSPTSSCSSEGGTSDTTEPSERPRLSATGSGAAPNAESGSPSTSLPSEPTDPDSPIAPSAAVCTCAIGASATVSTTTPTCAPTELDKSPDSTRFRYCAKASRSERNAGLPDGQRSTHPTVKPINLMRWLVRLVCPPDGVILDPFLGSGTTGCAAVLEGFDFIGIEREPEYVAIAEARISFWAQHVGREVDDVLGLHAASTKAEAAHSEAGQTSLLEAA